MVMNPKNKSENGLYILQMILKNEDHESRPLGIGRNFHLKTSDKARHSLQHRKPCVEKPPEMQIIVRNHGFSTSFWCMYHDEFYEMIGGFDDYSSANITVT